MADIAFGLLMCSQFALSVIVHAVRDGLPPGFHPLRPPGILSESNVIKSVILYDAHKTTSIAREDKLVQGQHQRCF